MKELIEKWSSEYDFVLIDSPSLLAVTDAAVLSKMADITLLVTRHAQSTRKGLERAWQHTSNRSRDQGRCGAECG